MYILHLLTYSLRYVLQCIGIHRVLLHIILADMHVILGIESCLLVLVVICRLFRVSFWTLKANYWSSPFVCSGCHSGHWKLPIGVICFRMPFWACSMELLLAIPWAFSLSSCGPARQSSTMIRKMARAACYVGNKKAPQKETFLKRIFFYIIFLLVFVFTSFFSMVSELERGYLVGAGAVTLARLQLQF